jgi:two-component system, OmpR family, clock-associated histidine kinase SasA
MSISVAPLSSSPSSLQLLLFVDRRPGTREQIRQIRALLAQLQQDASFDLKVIDVIEYPYLAERFRIVATPSLVKIAPDPKQTLAGSNLTQQLQGCWSRWQGISPMGDAKPDLEERRGSDFETLSLPEDVEGIQRYAELITLSDAVFQLRQERDELISQLNFRDQIIAMLAHDIRNPLTAASIAVETLEIANQPRSSEQSAHITPTLRTQLLKQARAQLRNMNTMITDILEATRGTQEGVRIQPGAIDLATVCREVMDNLEANVSARSQHIDTDIPTDLPTVYGDPEQIKQVITNLLDNAIKYTPEEGSITLSILHRTTQKIQVSICDNGPGIPEEKRTRIFEDRYRLERDEKRQGYGIGLSLCQRIVRAHYGQIWVDSVPKQGSCFHFTLPVYRTSA